MAKSCIPLPLFLLQIFLGCFFYSQRGQAQQYSYQHYGIEDGLAGSIAHGICQDRDGFLWFTTETGLSRFDGTHFKTFTREDGLPSNETFIAYTDAHNRVWITSFKNAICYYYQGKIYTRKNDPSLRTMSFSSEVVGFSENSAGDLLMQSTPVFYVLSSDNKVSVIGTHRDLEKPWKGRTLDLSCGITSLRIDVIDLPDSMRRLMQHRSEYIMRLDRQPFSRKKSFVFKYDGGLLCFFSDGTPHHFIPLPKATKMVKHLSDSLIAISDSENNGVRLYNIYKQHYVGEYLPDRTVNDVFLDREGNLWFSTMGSGVYKLSAPAPQTYYFIQKNTQLNVRCIRKERGRICVGTDQSAYWALEPETGSIYSREQWYKPVLVPAKPYEMSQPGRTPFIYCGSSDFMHLGAWLPKYHLHNCLKSLFIGNDSLLLASRSGAYLTRPGTWRVDTLHNNRTTCGYIQRGIIYIGTLNGLYTIDARHNKKFLGDSSSLFRNRISYFAESPDGTLWIGTYEEGVIGYRNGKIFVNLTRRSHGLSSDICRCLYAEGNTLWVGTEKGLNKIDLSDNKVQVVACYTVADGLNSDMINAIYVDRNQVYVGTPVGLTSFDELRMPKHSICFIRLLGIQVSGKAQSLVDSSFQLKHYDNNIRFEYAGISFLSMGAITYVYRLQGLSNTWQHTTETSLSYPSLPSGAYTLQLFAINKFGDRSPLLVRSFFIEQTFWEKQWVRLLGLVLLIALVCVVIQYAIYAIRKKGRDRRFMRHKMMELEQMALRAQMNPHFIFNCLNSVQRYIMKQDPMGANFYLARFASLIRQTLDNSTKLQVSLTEEIDYLSNYLELEQMQLSGRFTYSIRTEPGINCSETMVPNMVIQAYVENAVKHGVSQLSEGGTILISFRLLEQPARLQCTIEDNGPGILAMQAHTGSQTHHSKGMSITYRRLQIYQQLYGEEKNILVHIADLSTFDPGLRGTRVTLEFPL